MGFDLQQSVLQCIFLTYQTIRINSLGILRVPELAIYITGSLESLRMLEESTIQFVDIARS